ncbi:Small secreted domain [Nonomuraea maritima]|uniref:Small secreted domain n=1 Tax=Nonomuraea maritima TaxID=683260 RepID=A0A1G9N836_9ACTN|nr:chaplin family protein [Nonomuraea maritima]SDL82620.1 Small secreted domain [Nonomuraea maritima]
MRTWAKVSTPAALLAAAAMSFGGSATALADTSGDGSIGGGNQLDLPISLPIDISGNSIGVIGSSKASSQGGAEVVGQGRSGGNSDRTSGNGSVLGGNQVNAPITAPVNLCGNAISLVGRADAGCKGGSSVRQSGSGGGSGNRTSGNGSVLGGNQVNAPITAPVNICGNAVAIFGDATAGCKGGSSARQGGSGHSVGSNRTSGNGSVLGGNQVTAPITAPVNICGNTLALVGRAFSGCTGGSSAGGGGKNHYGSPKHAPRPGSRSGSGSGNDTDGRFGVGSGNQLIAPIVAPVNICGNAVGNATAGCTGEIKLQQSGNGVGGNRTTGQGGVLSGNQTLAPIAAPVNICGNTLALVGRAFAGCKGGATVKQSGGGVGGNLTSGRGGVLSGNQTLAPIAAPVNVCGNAAAVIGRAVANCTGGSSVHQQGSGAGGNRTSGRGGVLSGNQTLAPIAAPVNVCGNAAAVLGDAAAGCLGGASVGKSVGRGGPVARFARSDVKAADAKGKMLSVVPQDVSGFTKGLNHGGPIPGMGAAQLPVLGDVSSTLGLPQLPGLPGLPNEPQAPAQPLAPKAPKAPKTPKKHAHAAPVSSKSPAAISALEPATSLLASTPAGSVVTSTTRSLPVGDLGLMSAEQPAGVTGMNSGSLVALVFGAMLAASATLFASARRVRVGRK